MWNSKVLIPFLLLCLVSFSVSSPITHNTNEGRGFGSTLWGWITYPFSWWSYETTVDIPENDQLVSHSMNEPVESIEVGKRNVTVWCNDQTCTTMRCDIFGCTNLTCNIYDTDLNGECRIYNNIQVGYSTPKPIEVTSKPIESPSKPTEPQTKPIESTSKPAVIQVEAVDAITKPIVNVKPVLDEGAEAISDKVEISSNKPLVHSQSQHQTIEERPIELEMMLSATVADINKNRRKSTKELPK